MLMRYDPFNDFDKLTDQLFRGGRSSVMAVDAYQRDHDFFLHFDLPGVDPDSIDLTVEKNVLRVTAKRTWQREEGVQVLASERPQGTFTRQLFLGDNLDTEKIDAGYDNGVLTVRLPVADKAKPRKIEISGGVGGGKSIETNSTSTA